MRKLHFVFALLLTAVLAFGEARYVFYFIGDGMGPNVLLLTEMYGAQCGGQIGIKPLCMAGFPHYGSASTFSASNSITDSSAAGTCLASGEKTNNGTLGLNANGDPTQSIARVFKDRGYNVGICTSVSIDHATPGAFYANVKSRNDYYQIGKQLAESNFDFFAGSSFLQPMNKKNPQDINLYDYCEKHRYCFARGYNECREMIDGGKEKVILIQENEGIDRGAASQGHIPYAIDREKGDLTLPQITECAIDFLNRGDRPFFLMVEGGQIDWANHANDAATAIHEVLDFDESIRKAFEFYRKHPEETLIIVTADHETGGLALGNAHYTLSLDLLLNQKGSAQAISDRFKQLYSQQGKSMKFEQVRSFLSAELGLYTKVELSQEEDKYLQGLFAKMKKSKSSDAKSMYASVDALCNAAIELLNKHAEVGWTTHSHSAAAVPIFAIGKGAEHLSGFIDNSQIAPTILQISKQLPDNGVISIGQ